MFVRKLLHGCICITKLQWLNNSLIIYYQQFKHYSTFSMLLCVIHFWTTGLCDSYTCFHASSMSATIMNLSETSLWREPFVDWGDCCMWWRWTHDRWPLDDQRETDDPRMREPQMTSCRTYMYQLEVPGDDDHWGPGGEIPMVGVHNSVWTIQRCCRTIDSEPLVSRWSLGGRYRLHNPIRVITWILQWLKWQCDLKVDG